MFSQFIEHSNSSPSRSSVLTPELSSDFIYPKKGSNWRTVVINANSITHKKVEISAMADYCDPDLMLITETKLDSSIFSTELLPKGYMGGLQLKRWRGHDSDKRLLYYY